MKIIKTSKEEYPEINYDESLQITVKSRYNKLKILKEYQILPVLINLSVEELDIENVKVGVDIVFVIDTSGSMMGNKLKTVKETITFIIDQLDESDRVSLIEFNTNVIVHAKFNQMNDENKNEYKGIVAKLRATDSTDLKKAMEEAMN